MVVKTLDYPKAEIRMVCESEVERTKRLVASQKEPETISWLEGLPEGSVLFDIGSCTGAYALVAASLGHRVVAFEPSGPNYGRLVENLSLNPHLHVLALPYQLTWRTGQTFFGYSSLIPGSALHVAGASSSTGFTQAQVGWALDDLMAHPEISLPIPTAIKLDVDGHELSVIKGAQRTLEDVQTLLVELDTTSKDSGLIEPVLGMWGLSVKSRHPHGESPISNVVFER